MRRIIDTAARKSALSLSENHDCEYCYDSCCDSSWDTCDTCDACEDYNYCSNCEIRTSKVHWTDIEGDKILEIDVPGYGKDDLCVYIENAVLWVESKDNEKITHGAALPEGYEDPEECEVKDGIVRVLFRGPERTIKELKIN